VHRSEEAEYEEYNAVPMAYTVDPTVEGIRVVFRRKLSWRDRLLFPATAVSLWIMYFVGNPRRWYELTLPLFLSLLSGVFLLRRETIAVDHEFLFHVSKLGLSWTRRFKLADVQNPHYEPEITGEGSKAPSALQFEYRGKLKRVFLGVEPSEVEGMLTEIVTRFPELKYRWKTRQELYGSSQILGLNL